ncbi:MAG: glycoside hydrolase family 47 protein [Bacteroidales bacterium]|nr:glycoside hydrolase family 47 protein [Bacteroidales bacterium]
MKELFQLILVGLIAFPGCQTTEKKTSQADQLMAEKIKAEFVRSWNAYKTYAWGHDVLLPVSKSYMDWYEQSLHISPIDAYSTMKVMGLDKEAEEVQRYVVDSIDFDKDLFVKTFEVNIRILGGLLAMYEFSGDKKVLAKAEDFGKRLIPAFSSPTGIPYYWVNLKTGEAKGEVVNMAEGGSCLLEMGMLSRFTGNPVYFEKAKNASLAIFNRRSSIGLIGESINVETGAWTDSISHIGCCIDSYYEYLYKSWLLFKDKEIKNIWDQSIVSIQTYIADEVDTALWYGTVDMETGEKVNSVVTLYDAFFPALLALSGDLERAARYQDSWNSVWKQYGLEPMVYDYRKKEILNASYDLNPEIIESAYYLYYFTGDTIYKEMASQYFSDLMMYCRTEVAFTCIKDVTTKEQKDHMETFFLAETMKYLYLVFTAPEDINPDDCVFSTEAHLFRK